MMIGRNDPCWCGSRKKWKKCHFPKASFEDVSLQLTQDYYKKYQIVLKTPEQIAKIREACRVTAQILDEVCQMAKVGVTTNTLDAYVEERTRELGGIPAPLGYGDPPYPKSICTSINDEICHGIPDDQPLQEGDIMNIDVSVILDGYFGDSSRMVMIGRNISSDRKLVCDVSLKCLMEAIDVCKPGAMLYEIGDAIEECAARYKCSVVNQFVGHGVGLEFHEAPQVYHHRNRTRIPLAPGMTFTIEPMINAGEREAVLDPDNGWEARTRDGKPSAQWEHTLLITETGHEILTPYPNLLGT